MVALHFIFFKEVNFLRLGNKSIRVNAGTLMTITSPFEILTAGEWLDFCCNRHQLLSICETIADHVDHGNKNGEINSVRMLDFNASAQQALLFFLQTNRNHIIPYLIYYCLGRDWHYFCQMFSTLLAQGGELFDFMREYAFNPWPVERYAAMLGLSTRKFNYLFKECYGVTPKYWLRERRLTRARTLLEQTSLTVANIAEQSGYSNHAYFSESFRKYFSCSPSAWREKYLLNLSSDRDQYL